MSSEHQSSPFVERPWSTIGAGAILPVVLLFKGVGIYSDGFARYKLYASSSKVFELTGIAVNVHIAQLIFGAMFLNTYYFWHHLFPNNTLVLRISNLFGGLAILLTFILWFLLP